MKKRLSRILNFFAFNLLFFALYLNFIHKDNNAPATASPQSNSVQGTVLVSNPDQYLHKSEKTQMAAEASESHKQAYN
jgi:hypothetical protein